MGMVGNRTFSFKKFSGWKRWQTIIFENYFLENRKKNNTLVDSETIEKHAQIQELVQSEPSLPTIEIVEKYFGPQNRSHVFGFAGKVKAKDLKGGTSSKAELLTELRSTQSENQSLKDCISTFENEIKELKQFKDFFFPRNTLIFSLQFMNRRMSIRTPNDIMK